MVRRLTRSCRVNACMQGDLRNQHKGPAEKMMGTGYNANKLFREALRQSSKGLCETLLQNGSVKLPDAIMNQSLEFDDLELDMQEYIRMKLGTKTKSANDE